MNYLEFIWYHISLIFKLKANTLSHMDKRGNGQLQKCIKCNEKFISLKKLKEHKRKFHSM